MRELKYRHELKFICQEQLLYLLERRIKCICKLDSHIKNGTCYRIRSLYFDTIDNSCYYENEAGLDNRKKYRIRIYDGNTSAIKLECKYSVHGMKAKESCTITKQQCENMIYGLPVIVGEDQKLLEKFLLDKRLLILQPKVIVEYTRTPYVYGVGNVRITLDRNIQSSFELKRFFEKDIAKRSIMKTGEHILEVKYDEVLPEAVLSILSKGISLQKSSFSKYALCRKYNTR